MGADPDRKLARSAMQTLGTDGRLDRVAAGLDTTYRLRQHNGEVLALRVGGVLSIRRPAAILAEASWIEGLERRDHFRVPHVIRWPGIGPVLGVDDDTDRPRGVMALGWLAGRRFRKGFGPAHARALGAATASLHGGGRSVHLPEGAWLKTWDRYLMAGAGDLGALSSVAGDAALETVATLEERLASAEQALGTAGFGVINADLGPHNTVWSGGKPGLVDFNDSGWGYLAFDLARFLRNLAGRHGGQALVAAALRGYQEVAELPEGYPEYGRLFGAAADAFLARYLAPQVAKRGPETAARVRSLLDGVAKLIDDGAVAQRGA